MSRAPASSAPPREAGIGAPIRRREDERFVTGRGRYLGDLAVADVLHVVFLRSPHAHARILHIDAGHSLSLQYHERKDETIYVLEGELKLVEDGGETVLRAGECAAFPKGTGNGHHLVNASSTLAVYLEVGSRNREDLTTCSDIDMKSSNADGRFVHKDGTPYP